MTMRRVISPLVLLAVLTLAATAVADDQGGPDDALRAQLTSSRYVYISSQRKDGSFGSAAEIWFMYAKGAVWVVTPPTTWRARRIKAGRPAARIAVGKPDGPSFEATGEIAKDAEVQSLIFQTYAKKYPEGWPKHEARFRAGLADGSRILIKYTPK